MTKYLQTQEKLVRVNMASTFVSLFKPTNMRPTGVFVCNGLSGCGKSTLARELVRNLCQNVNVCRVVVVGDKAIENVDSLSISQRLAKTYVHTGTEQEGLKTVLDEQKRDKTPGHSGIVVVLLDIDTALFDKSPLWDELFAKAKSLNMAIVVTTLVSGYLSNTSKWQHVDLFFDFGNSTYYGMKQTWKLYFQNWTSTTESFKKVHDTCTQSFGCMVYDALQPSKMFYYQSTPEQKATTTDSKSADICKADEKDKAENNITLTQLFSTLAGPKRFHSDELPCAGVLVCWGRAGCGKSMLAHDLARTFWQRNDFNHVVLMGHDADTVNAPSTKTVLTLDPEQSSLEAALQRILDHQSHANARENIVILWDQAMPSKSLGVYERLFSEAAKLNILLVVTTSWLNDFSLEQRRNIDCLFTFSHPSNQTLWNQFFQAWGTFEQFQSLLEEKSKSFQALVYNKANPNAQRFYSVIAKST